MIQRLTAIAVLAGVAAAPLLAADLAVEVHDVRSVDGRLYVAVHSPESKSTFPAVTGAVATLRPQAQVGALRLVLRDLPPGRYAVAAFHDENDNGELDSNLLGVPSEGYGFANDPDATFGPPDFEAASVVVGEDPAVAVMTLHY